MKTGPCLNLSTATALLFWASSASAEVRTWTSASGSTVDAEFVSQTADSVILKSSDGRSLTIRTSALSDADRTHVRDLPAPSSSPALTGRAVADAAALPRELRDLFGKELVDAEKKSVPSAELAEKTIGIYFSAHWCGPCRQFTPTLVKVYGELKQAGKPFEIVFVSLDHSRREMFDYMEEAEMPWLALPHGSKEGKKLKETFSVSGIPRLVIVDSKGTPLNPDARGAVMLEGAKAYDKWVAPR